MSFSPVQQKNIEKKVVLTFVSFEWIIKRKIIFNEGSLECGTITSFLQKNHIFYVKKQQTIQKIQMDKGIMMQPHFYPLQG